MGRPNVEIQKACSERKEQTEGEPNERATDTEELQGKS